MATGSRRSLREFLTRHVRNTCANGTAREMADQIELNIGKDLQAIA